MKKYYVDFGIYTRSGHIMGTESEEIEAVDFEDAKEVAKMLEENMEDYYPCVMIEDIIELEEVEEEPKSGLPF